MLEEVRRTAVAASTKVLVAFRNDDLSARSDADHERLVAQLFLAEGIPQTLAIVPEVTDGDFHDPSASRTIGLWDNRELVRLLLDCASRAGWELAMHGLTHRPNRTSMPGRDEFTEFRGLSADQQQAMIERGTSSLYRTLGVRPTTFVPPWNLLDANTIRACVINGYRTVSSGPYAPPDPALACVGTNCTLGEFPEALRHARSAGGPAVLVVCYHSRTLRTAAELAQLAGALSLVRDNPGCHVLTLADLARRLGNLAFTYNQAGMNIAPQHELAGTFRAKAAIYQRAARRVGMGRPLDRAYAQATWHYRRGEYAAAAGLCDRITCLCRSLITRCHVAVAASGVALGLLTTFVAIALASSAWVGIAAGVFAGIAVAGLVLRHRATADQTRFECLVASSYLLLGYVLGVVAMAVVLNLHELIRVLKE